MQKDLIKTSCIHIAKTKKYCFPPARVKKCFFTRLRGNISITTFGTVLFLIGSLHTRFCFYTFFKVFLIFLSFSATREPTRTQCSFIFDIKDRCVCGESNPYQNLTKFQNIMSSIVGFFIFSLSGEI